MNEVNRQKAHEARPSTRNPGRRLVELLERVTVAVESLAAKVGDSKSIRMRRVALGPDAPFSIREAAELLPGNHARNRALLASSPIVRGGEGGPRWVRWGDVLDLFPPVGEQDSAGLEKPHPRSPSPRRPKSNLRLADL